jgi:hypothetical protein
MPMFFFAVLVLVSFNAQAEMPSVGDYIKFDSTLTNADGSKYTGTLERELLSYDAPTDTWTQRLTTTYPEMKPIVQESTLKTSDLYRGRDARAYVAACGVSVPGARKILVLRSGTSVPTCIIEATSPLIGFYWVANVPFGIAQSDTVDASKTQDVIGRKLELNTYRFGR